MAGQQKQQQRGKGLRIYQAISWIFTTFVVSSLGVEIAYPEQHAVSPQVDRGPREFLQLYKPPLAPLTNTSSPHDDFSGEACSQSLLQHEFINSYGKPGIASYSPPASSCEWNTVYFHLYTTSKGRQYDRLAFLFFDDTELWRTSTAEPISKGIYFKYTKDLTHFSTLLRQNGTIILDMGNLVTDILTGTFTVSLTAHYFNLDLPPQQKTADIILPMSRMQGSIGQPSHFVLPDDTAKTSIVIPKNLNKAVLSIIASGNADEEFWYTNVPDDLVNSFSNTTLLGHSSYRELQLFVDGVMVDAIMPVPTIYTGGVNPGLWKPIVCPYAYDLWEIEIDITLWVAGKTSATIELKVEGLRGDRTRPEIGGGIGQNWYVSGRTFLWTHPHAPQLNASEFSVKVYPPEINIDWVEEGVGANKEIQYKTSVYRKITISREFSGGSLWWNKYQRYGIDATIFANGDNQTLWTNTSATEDLQTASPPENPSSHFRLHPRNSIRELDFGLRLAQAYIPYPDKSFYIYGQVNAEYKNGGLESTLLTDKSPIFINLFPENELGAGRYRDRRHVNSEASYFSAAEGSNKTSTSHATSHQGYNYELDPTSFHTDRTIKEYKRETRSTYAKVIEDSQSVNGLPVKQADLSGSDSTSRVSPEDEIGNDETVCARFPHGRGQPTCPI